MELRLASFVTLGLMAVAAWAQDAVKAESPKRISTAEAQAHYQETCTVTGKVAQVSIREKLVYLNLDKKFPDTPLAGIVFARNTNQFGDLKNLEGKAVEITGKIDEFKERLQIVLTSTNQLRVVEANSN